MHHHLPIRCDFHTTAFQVEARSSSMHIASSPKLLAGMIVAVCFSSTAWSQLTHAGDVTISPPMSAIDSRGDTWQPATVMPSAASSDSSTGNDFELGLVDSSTPAPTPPPRASADSTTFRLAPTKSCNETVASTAVQVYTKNRVFFEKCVDKAKYQIFPFSGVLPTPEQITMQAIVPACTAIFTGVLLSEIPQCDISSMPLKSVVETLLKVTVDIRSGLPCPDSQQFFNLVVWRRNSNLAQEASLPYDSGSELYAEYTRNLWKSLTEYNVRIAPDFTIRFDGDELGDDANESTADATGASFAGTQKATTPPRAALSEATTSTSSGVATIFEPRTATLTTGVAVVLLATNIWS